MGSGPKLPGRSSPTLSGTGAAPHESAYIAGMDSRYEELVSRMVREALAEDIGDGDHSTMGCIPSGAHGAAVLHVKQEGVLAGVALAERIFRMDDPGLRFDAWMRDGDRMRPGDRAFRVEGRVHTILRCERVVLNCLQRMSGIATRTRMHVDRLEGYRTRLLDTRKTTPNFRWAEKEAVRIGGGHNHRQGLYDMVMLKDNHIDFAGGIPQAIERAWNYVRHHRPGLRIEVEARSLDEVCQVLEAGEGRVFRVMFDNFTPPQVREALALVAGRMETEASGGIGLDNIVGYAETGVDWVSVGGLIHQAASLDLSLKAES
jgi:nicotinate-nucleotide pyrophosphorylase (carboxylating)